MPNIYLDNTPLETAIKKYIATLPSSVGETKSEEIPVTKALERITSKAIFACNNSPLYDCAAMDGIAVIAEKTDSARDIAPLTLQPGDYKFIDTGDPILPPYNAVIMIEDIQTAPQPGCIIIRKAATSFQHVRPIGEDIVQGEMVLPANHRIRPVDIGALLSGGIVNICVKKLPSVGIIPTGTELVEPGTSTKKGDIIESNSYMLSALVSENGGVSNRYPIVQDDKASLHHTLKHAVQHNDIVLLCSGTSAGREDFTKSTIEELGKVVFHGIAIKPGKPAILAIVDDKPVIGIPGYPVSAYVVYKNIVEQVLTTIGYGQVPHPVTTTITATLSRRLVSSVKHKEFVRVRLGKISNKYVAVPLARGAGSGMSLVRADGFCTIDKDIEGIEAGTDVDIALITSQKALESSLLSIGSHDIIMDILANMLYNTTRLSSAHVGTMGGLVALKNNECHIAPIHHLDEESGTYNTSIIEQFFDANTTEKVVLIKGVERIQGIMIAKGNPLNITGIKDLPRCKYVNRSLGTGTRMFLDYQLKLAGISPAHINGYDRDVSTHMNVGGVIAGGSADAGIGVMSAAIACGLDFIPVGVEEYDFAVYESSLALTNVQNFIRVLKSQEFCEALELLGGYNIGACGDVYQ